MTETHTALIDEVMMRAPAPSRSLYDCNAQEQLHADDMIQHIKQMYPGAKMARPEYRYLGIRNVQDYEGRTYSVHCTRIEIKFIYNRRVAV